MHESLRRQPSGPREYPQAIQTGESEGYPIYAYLQRSLSCGSADSYASTSSASSFDSVDSCLSISPTCSLQRRPHIRRAGRRKFRPLPPPPGAATLQNQDHEPGLPLPPSSPSHKVRRLPVPPLPMTPFPPISPTRCTTPAPSFHLSAVRHQSYNQIDWDILLSEIMSSGSH
ncbi:hypothetical protein HGRIS_009886 [Hohenbuehelia grisea]|uniref:Uncharacterized protein n=1 Tax=Hohenbuehelia grisea TaxID=104357 RepID=A0ABR3J2I6_9AGAR